VTAKLGSRLIDMSSTGQMQRRPLISVLTPVLNEGLHIRESLLAMRAQSVLDAEFLVIDGGSTDETREIVREAAREDPRIRLLTNPARRTPHALNLGLHAARGEFVARMDAHSIYPSRYLAEGIARLERGDVQWSSGPAIPVGNTRGSRRVARALSCRLGVGGASFRTMQPGEIDVDAGFSGVWRRTYLEEIGGWDEGWPVNQDGEMGGRVRERGDRIVCLPSMAASYIPRSSIRALTRQYWTYGQFKAKTCGRHPTSMRPGHVLPPALVVTGAIAMLPLPIARVARAGVLVYAVALGHAARSVSRSEPLRDQAGVAACLLTMHAAWGAGFLVGSRRFGVPTRALRELARRGLRAAGASARARAT
jgi:succinoglycan biosynthesis protein ExoA